MKVLDQGFVRVVEFWGSDERIIEAARMSTQKGFEGWGPKEDGNPGDEKLLRYLWKNNHATPFEMAGAIFEIQAPIFVFREWYRHRTQSYNEASARFAPLPEIDYLPTVERCMLGGGHFTKQAGAATGAKELTPQGAEIWLDDLRHLQRQAQRVYEHGLEMGIPKEIARLALTVGRYSKMRASANLRNWLGFLTLRQASNAQLEIREYANAVHDALVPLFPRTMGLFDERT